MSRVRAGRRHWLWSVTGLAVVLVGCGGTRPIPLRDLENSPSSYAGHIVTVRGCYYHGTERILLQPCTKPQPGEVAWVISRMELEEMAKTIPGYSTGALGYERPSAREKELARQLSGLPRGALAEVDLRGELHSSSSFEYGIDPGYRYQFVVHRVLRVSPRSPSR